jgi:hypothetical protein
MEDKSERARGQVMIRWEARRGDKKLGQKHKVD